MKTKKTNPKMYFHLKSVNEDIVEKKIYFKPVGPCLFEATLTYEYADLKASYIFESGHRVFVRKFGTWVQQQQVKIEKQFFNHVMARRLEAHIKNDPIDQNYLDTSSVVIEFKTYTL